MSPHKRLAGCLMLLAFLFAAGLSASCASAVSPQPQLWLLSDHRHQPAQSSRAASLPSSSTLGLEHLIVPERVLMRLHSPSDASAAERLAQQHGVTVASVIQPLGIYHLVVPAGSEQAMAEVLEAEPEVAWAQTEAVASAAVVPNDPLYARLQWNLRQIGMEAAWSVTQGDGQVVVAVLDTGVDLDHPDLAANLVPGYDFINDHPVAQDDSSHGTHTAGIIAARGDNQEGIAGVVWNVQLMPVKVLNARGLGPESAMIRGLVFALERGARVLNLSSGTTQRSDAMAEAVAYAHEQGALLVSAAGNSGDQDNPLIYPAAYPEVLAVGAVDRSGAVAPFSQRHGYVSVVAPGVDIPSAAWPGAGVGQYALATGTSAAAPHVAGLVALLWSLEPGLTSSQVRELITAHAEPLGPAERDDAYGHGLINAARTLQALRPPTDATPTPVAMPSPTPVAPPPDPPTTPMPLPTLEPLPEAAPAERTPSEWYFAEGTTHPPFHTWLHIFNPEDEAVEARVSYLLTEGPVHEQRLTIPAQRRTSVFVNQVLPATDFSVRVAADATVLVERAMFFGRDGHVTTGVSSPSATWYLAEGASTPFYDTWVLLQNPNPWPVHARLTFFPSDGDAREHVEFLPPHARRTVYANLILQAEGFSTTVEADAPIVVERAMYLDGARSGHGTVAVAAPANVWHLAEGSSSLGFETWLPIYNPTDTPAEIQVRYLLEQGDPIASLHQIPPRGRLRIPVHELLPNASFGAVVESTTPVVVERVMYFGQQARGAHVSSAVAHPALDWYFPEGTTRPPFEQFLAVLNPHAESVDLELALLPTDGGEATRFMFQMRPDSRLTLDVNQLAPDTEASARLGASQPVVVERSMYFNNRSGGTSAPGVTRPPHP